MRKPPAERGETRSAGGSFYYVGNIAERYFRNNKKVND